MVRKGIVLERSRSASPTTGRVGSPPVRRPRGVATTATTRIRRGRESTEAEMVARATYVLVLLRLGGLERPVDPFLHVEAVLGERGDVLKRPF